MAEEKPSLAGLPKEVTENPEERLAGCIVGNDVLAEVLRTVRLSGSVQFCFMPAGAWFVRAPSRGLPANGMPFHIVAEGSCWLKMDGKVWMLSEGDIVAFPFGSPHELGVGNAGRLIEPVENLPPRPWRQVPLLPFGDAGPRVRLLCGYLVCEAIHFRPLRQALPPLIHARTKGASEARWLAATIEQIVAEVDRPQSGGMSMVERLTEITFIELLRHEINSAGPPATGWLAALGDPALGRCISIVHADPRREWSIQDLSTASGLSRSSLAERFETMLGTSPMRYVRDWRLCLASMALSSTSNSITAIAYDAGYGTEAAFSRAFSRVYGAPPGTWRQQNAKRRLVAAHSDYNSSSGPSEARGR